MVRIGIVGVGMMGSTHFQAYEGLDDAQVIAIADIDEKKSRGDLSESWSNLGPGSLTQLPMERIKGMKDYRELIAMDDVDVIDVCVPTPDHAEIAIAALEAGKHVFLEKPMASTVAEGEQILSKILLEFFRLE